MSSIKLLNFGNTYFKKDLSLILGESSIKTSREGIFNCTKSKSTLLFVTLEKKDENLNYNDYFSGDFFHWDSQKKQHINTPVIQKIVTGVNETYLFIRIKGVNKGKTLPFYFCGKLEYYKHDSNTSNPVQIVFQNKDYDDLTNIDELLEIYRWRPSKKGLSSSNKIDMTGVLSDKRKSQYVKPNKTERRGLVTSRVGQGWYREKIIEKWGGKCPVTGCNITPILISSHIVPWSQSNSDERLDVENGILLSPNIDSLFDKHLISFEDDGSIILISEKVDLSNRGSLNIHEEIKIPVTEGMKKYLKRHRERFYSKR